MYTGAYGRVTAGSVMKGRQTMTVAVKTLKAVNSIEDVDNFLSEALIMQNFHHPNIVGLVGVCLRLSGPPLVCLEYMAEGDLRSYLQHLSKSISLEDIWSEVRYTLSPTDRPQQGTDYIPAGH
eukprot:scpid94377/ scgid5656/ Hepatocyte growth factor receptor; HGF/SF receptor; Proto-oncogene c-Met; Scatter factor receptor; Tyrosine-protein kinase Met